MRPAEGGTQFARSAEPLRQERNWGEAFAKAAWEETFAFSRRRLHMVRGTMALQRPDHRALEMRSLPGSPKCRLGEGNPVIRKKNTRIVRVFK